MADPFSSQVINDRLLTKRGFFPLSKKKKTLGKRWCYQEMVIRGLKHIQLSKQTLVEIRTILKSQGSHLYRIFLNFTSDFNCVSDVDHCRKHPCKNGATCVAAKPFGYKCDCTQGFTGSHCEKGLAPTKQTPAQIKITTTGAHNPERATPILGLCQGAFTDRFIFRHILEQFFPRKWNLCHVYKRRSIRYQKGKRDVIKRQQLSFLGQQVLLTGLLDLKDILNSSQNRSKNKLVRERP